MQRAPEGLQWIEDTQSGSVAVVPRESGPCPVGETSYPSFEPPSRPQVGSIVGYRYRIIALLGLGGMGEIFEAENILTHKRVALKWLHQGFGTNPVTTERLLREAQAVGRIRHPNVIDVYDVGREGDAMFLVMELLVGETLADRLSGNTLPSHALIALLLPAMRGVAAAHRRGVIHRDIKPDNIFLSQVEDQTSPIPKVLDFGISKLVGDDDCPLTLPGLAIGTPLYMPIEQLRGDADVDARVDVYAFGVILYEARTGEPPFAADAIVELVHMVATREPTAPDVVRRDLPGPLARLIEWAMAKDRELRIGTLDELIHELEPFASPRMYDGSIAERVAPPASAPPAAAPATEPARKTQRFLKQLHGRSSGLMPALALLVLVAGVWRLLHGAYDRNLSRARPPVRTAVHGARAADSKIIPVGPSPLPAPGQPSREVGPRVDAPANPMPRRTIRRRAERRVLTDALPVLQKDPTELEVQGEPLFPPLQQPPAMADVTTKAPGDKLESPYLRDPALDDLTSSQGSDPPRPPVAPGDVLVAPDIWGVGMQDP